MFLYIRNKYSGVKFHYSKVYYVVSINEDIITGYSIGLDPTVLTCVSIKSDYDSYVVLPFDHEKIIYGDTVIYYHPLSKLIHRTNGPAIIEGNKNYYFWHGDCYEQEKWFSKLTEEEKKSALYNSENL